MIYNKKFFRNEENKMANYINYSYDELKTFCTDAFLEFGFSKEECEIIVDVLLTSDLYGIESHGMQRLVRYHKGIEKGLIKIDAKPEIVVETPVSAVIEGNDGMGQLLGHKAMTLAIEKAKKVGMAVLQCATPTTTVLQATTQRWLVRKALSVCL